MLLSILVAVIPFIHNAQELIEQLPMSESAVENLTEATLSQFQEELNNFLSIPEEKRTFDNTIRAWDFLNGNVDQTLDCLLTLLQIHPEKNVRDSLSQAYEKIKQTVLDALTTHPEIYQACLSIKNASPVLSEQEAYYLNQLLFRCRIGKWRFSPQELLFVCKKNGMQLSEEERSLFMQTQQDISILENLFNKNIAEDATVLYASEKELTGLDPSWISSKERTAEGTYRLLCDLPTYNAVLTQCSIQNTRKVMDDLFTNRAFPQNEEVVKQLISKRDALAKILDFPSYAAYDLVFKMAGSPENVEAFLAQIKEKIAKKADLEFHKFVEELPEGISLTPSGQLERCDSFFVRNIYKQKHFSLNPKEIAEYLPLDKTFPRLLRIYEQFFGFSIQEIPHSLPIPDLKALEIRDTSEQLLGVVLVDLFPRPGKCSHVGVCCPLIPPFSPPGRAHYPAAVLVIGNFTKPSKERPSLLTHEEATSLFHEFGHAIHELLGKNQFLSLCGTKVKKDFVEVPSQVLERWLLDPTILKSVTSHYLTGEPMPDAMIQNMLRAHRSEIGTLRQIYCYRSEYSLALFSEGADKNPADLMQQIALREMPHSTFGSKNHSYASWWHVSGYGPNYYSYLWSQVYALDLFEKIQQEGLLNSQTGAVYAQTILHPGGSRDPNQLISDFLGRKPSLDPFFKELTEE